MAKPAPPAAFRLLRFSLLLSTVGLLGVFNGLGTLTGSPPTQDIHMEDPVVQETAVALARAITDLMWSSPLRRPTAAANLVVSAMLMVGGTLIAMRRASAIWWNTQALLANVAWTVLDVAQQVTVLVTGSAVLAPLLERNAEASLAAEGYGPELAGTVDGRQWLVLWGAAFVLWGLLRIGIYGLVLWRIRRPQVRELLG